MASRKPELPRDDNEIDQIWASCDRRREEHNEHMRQFNALCKFRKQRPTFLKPANRLC